MALAKLGYKRAPREVLTATRTYYVRTDGNDANNGLANTSGGAFLTIQKAVDRALSLDLAGFTVTIQVADGTYTAGAIIGRGVGISSPSNLVIQGNSGTPANVIISTTASNSDCFRSSVPGAYALIKDMTLTNSGSSGYALRADSGAVLHFSNIRFNGTRTHMLAYIGGTIVAKGNYAITAGGNSHLLAAGGTIDINESAPTITITGTPAFSPFLVAQRNSLIEASAAVFSGSATGSRFSVAYGGVVFTGTNNLNFFPGNAAGTLSSGGIYDNLLGGARELLTANRTYYVRTDGSDANDGLTNTAGGAFLTIQKAVAVTQALDRSIYNVIISVGAGTYTSQIGIFGMGPGSGSVSIIGAGATTIISTTSTAGFYLRNVTITLQNMKLTTTTSGDCIRAEAGCYVSHSGLEFGSCAGNHIWVEQWTRVVCIGNYTISGGANCHVFVRYSGASYECYSKTITLTGTPAFASSFVAVTTSGNIVHGACTFSGSATGKRYAADNGGIIDSGAGGANYFPGNVAGTGTNLGTSPYGAYI